MKFVGIIVLMGYSSSEEKMLCLPVELNPRPTEDANPTSSPLNEMAKLI